MHNNNDNSEESEDSKLSHITKFTGITCPERTGGCVGSKHINYYIEVNDEIIPEIKKVEKVIHDLCDLLGSKWSEFAEKIGLSKGEIDDIREEYCGSSADKAMSEMAAASLKIWRSSESGKNATHHDLISALRSMRSYDIIEKLEQC